MADEQIISLLETLAAQVVGSQNNPTAAVAVLISETVKFRDKLKEETGKTLTVADTRSALDALELYLKGEQVPGDLTPEQRSLVQTYIDRLTLFNK